MSLNQLQKATITILDGSHQNETISVLFNPSEYSFEKSNSYKAVPVPGLGTPLIQFVNGESDSLSMELFLDDYTDPLGPKSAAVGPPLNVAKRLKGLFQLLEVDRALHAPPHVRFNWGPLEFFAVIEKLSRKVTKFQPDGTPARATVSVVFKEYRSLQRQLREPRRESADRSKRRVFTSDKSLWLFAADEYDSPHEWPRIAEANDLDDPRDVKPGDWLILPPMEGPDAAADLL
jgi:nucleoid-associated protein YgaU